MKSQPYIFINYSRKDKIFVDKLSKELNEYGINTWIDTQEISPGTMWQAEIKVGLEKSSIILVVLSTNYLSSSWTSIELGLALNKKIIPIKIDDLVPDKIPKPLRNLQWIEFYNNYKQGFDLLKKSIPPDYKSEQPLKAKKSKTKGYVFLSFSEDDSDFINGLRDFLKSQDFAYWDFEEGDRNYHIQFFLELESVINDSEAVISIISPSWKNSKWTIREFVYSEEIGKPVLLLRSKETRPILAIAGLPYIDFENDIKKGFDKLEKELRKRLN